MGKRKREWPACAEPGCGTAVREVGGEYRGPRQPELDGRCSRHRVEDTEFVPTQVPVSTPEEEEPEATLDESPVGISRIASLRDALRGDLLSSEVAGLIRDQLLEGLRASKTSFVTCPGCSRRHPVTLPDLSTRIAATQRLVEELEGKIASQHQSAESEIDREATKLLRDRSALTDAQLAEYISRLERELAE